jgi:hypothetical protein
VTPSSVPDETMQPEQIDAGQADIEYPR